MTEGEKQNPSIAPVGGDKIKNYNYVIDFILPVGMARVPLSAPNKDSLLAVATVIVSANIQHLYGFNAYLAEDPACRHEDPATCKDLQFIAHVPAMDIMAQISGILQKAAGRQLLTAAIPLKSSNQQNLREMLDAISRQQRGG